MADNFGNQLRITDGSTSFEGGVDSAKVTTVASKENPAGLGRNQVAWLTNGTVRGGGITPRNGWLKILTDFDGDGGLYQGAEIYTPDSAVPYIMMSAAGRIFRLDVWATPNATEIGIVGDPNPAAQEQSFWQQCEQFMIIQAGDYITNPLIWDGVTMRRSGGYGAYTTEVPPGRTMEYYMGRHWVQVGARNYAAGDIVYGPSGTAGYNYRDSVLYWTENTYFAGGGAFNVPNQFGAIRAIKHPATLDTALGEGPLTIFARDAIYALDVPVDRNAWGGVTAESQPRQRVIQLKYGSTSDRGVAQINGDLFYPAYDGIRSLAMAVRNYQQWGQVPLSRNLNRLWQFQDKSFARFASGIEFDNRYLLTVLPQTSDIGAVHKGIATLDFDIISSFNQEAPPAWEGMLEGLDILQILQAESGGRQRAFALVRGSDTGRIEVWELTSQYREDEGDKRINMAVEFPAYNWNTQFALKKLDCCEMWFDKIYGTVDAILQYRVDQDPCWIDWYVFQMCNARTSCEDIDDVCYGEATTYREGYRATKMSPIPPFRSDMNLKRPSNIGYQFQARLLTKGWCRVRGLLLHAIPVAKEPYKGLT